MKKSTCLFFLAFLCGVICANVLGIASGRELGAMNEYFMNRYMYADIQGRELFLYLFYERVPEFFMLLVLSVGIYGTLVIDGYVSCLCFSVGFLSVISIMNYGMKGVLLMAGFFLPQWLLYVMVLAVWYYGLRSYKRQKKEYLPEKRRKRRGVQYAVYFGAAFFLLCGGLFMESYVNPFLLQKIIRLL